MLLCLGDVELSGVELGTDVCLGPSSSLTPWGGAERGLAAKAEDVGISNLVVPEVLCLGCSGGRVLR